MLNCTFFTGEAWFHLSKYINFQNDRTWATKKHYNFVKTELQSIKIGVWIAISRRKIMNDEIYCTDVIQPFIGQLHNDVPTYTGMKLWHMFLIVN